MDLIDTKMRKGSAIKMMMKRRIKAGRILSKALDGLGEYSKGQILAAESIIRLCALPEAELMEHLR
jgi:hypothetical protein